MFMNSKRLLMFVLGCTKFIRHLPGTCLYIRTSYETDKLLRQLITIEANLIDNYLFGRAEGD